MSFRSPDVSLPNTKELKAEALRYVNTGKVDCTDQDNTRTVPRC